MAVSKFQQEKQYQCCNVNICLDFITQMPQAFIIYTGEQINESDTGKGITDTIYALRVNTYNETGNIRSRFV